MSDARSYRAVVERVDEVAPATRTLALRLPRGGGLAFRPGQFLSLSLPLAERPLVRAYSIASSPDEPELLEICLNLVPGGLGSAYLFGLEIGAEIDFTGPWGTFVVPTPAPARCVFIAEGAGIVPLRPMLHAVLKSDALHELHLLRAAAAERFLLYRAEIEMRAREDARLRLETLVEGENDPEHAKLEALVARRFATGDVDRTSHFFVCGVGAIIHRLRDLLRGAGYERRAVHYEKW